MKEKKAIKRSKKEENKITIRTKTYNLNSSQLNLFFDYHFDKFSFSKYGKGREGSQGLGTGRDFCCKFLNISKNSEQILYKGGGRRGKEGKGRLKKGGHFCVR